MLTRFTFFALIMLWIAGGCSPMKRTEQSFQVTQSPTAESPLQALMAPRQPDARIHFGRLGIEDGLSQSSVMAIIQDQKGFIWFGTEDGLNRYDGVKFKVFRPVQKDPSSLSDVWVSSLAVDRNGIVWVGTRQGGLNRYDERTGLFTRFQHENDDEGSLWNNHVHAILADAAGRLWVGTEAGLDLYHSDTGLFEHFRPSEVGSLPVFTIVEDSQGGLWLGTEQGLWRFDPTKGTFKSYPVGDQAYSVFSILVNPDGSLWLGANGGGIVRVIIENGTRQSYLPEDGLSNEGVRSLQKHPSGKIWVGTTHGLNLFDPEKGEFFSFFSDITINHALSADFIHTLYQDAGGILWIGTYGGGISYYDPFENRFAHYYHDPMVLGSLGQNSVFSFAPAPNGRVWMATSGGGLDRFNPDTETFTHYRNHPEDPKSLRSNFVWSVLADREGFVWVGTQEGLDRLDPFTGDFSHFLTGEEEGALPGSAIFSLYQDDAGVVWAGTDAGLARYDAYSHTFTHYEEQGGEAGLNDGMVTKILQTRSGVLWVGTFSGGLSRLDPDTGTFRHFVHDSQKRNSISNNSILALHESRDGILWVGTAGGGLNRYDPRLDIFTSYSDADGLPNNVIYGILEDEQGSLWLSTNFGIAKFDPKTGRSRNFTTADGLQSNEFNMGAYAKDASGRMYFGGLNGINIFTPSELTDNPPASRMNLVSITQDGAPISGNISPEVLREIILRPPDNSFEFEFASMNFSQGQKSQYAYMLDGFDKDWFYAGTTRTGRYANLPGGAYVLKMIAANADGQWNEAGIALKISVIPPFWQTWWFYILCALGLVMSGAGVYRLRVRNIEGQRRELERLVNERARQIEQLFEQTKELAILEERTRLARDLHDSAKQKAFAALAQLGAARSLARSNSEKAARHLQEAEVLVSEVIQEISFLIQEIHPAALEEKGLAAVLREYAFEWGSRTDIEVDLNFSGEKRLSLEIEQALYRAIQEAFANVARHSEAKAVKLALVIEPDLVLVSICDDGHGFDSNQSSNGMGLRSIRERVERLGGFLDIESAVGCGTRLNIQIPVRETL